MLVKPVIPLLEYVVFYDYIKNELCVNKENKAMGCNGKCHLKKELARASEQDKNASHNFSVESNVVFYQDFHDFSIVYTLLIATKPHNFYYNNLYSQSFYKVLIKPPVYLS